MGNCVSIRQHPNVTHPETFRSLKTASFKVTHADLVKEKSTNIYDDYTFIETLGKGGFGEVKKAKHKKTGIIRAVKILNRMRQGIEQYEKILNEIKIVKILDHPHIMKIIEFYQDDTKLYIVSEFYEGTELFQKVANHATLGESQVAAIMKQVLSAVNYCHKRGIMHRDLKPENIMYESKKPEAVLKIIDFGTSQAFKQGEKLQKPLGTCYYVAPEVLRKEYTEKCDVWSSGIIMYFLLCGHPPFVGSTEKKVLERVLAGQFTFEHDEWKDITEGGKNLITKMLEVEPEKRYTAEQVLNDPWFQNMNSKEAVSAKTVSTNLKHLQKFHAEKKIQEAIWIFMVSFFSTNDDKVKLMETFEALDKDKNGTLSREEIKAGFKEMNGVEQTDAEIDELIKKIDNNDSGCIDYSEFVTATMSHMRLLSKSKLEAAFHLFDQDGSGFLTVDELKELLHPDRLKSLQNAKNPKANEQESDDEMWQDLMNEVDENHDGKVSMKEFKDLMYKLVD